MWVEKAVLELGNPGSAPNETFLQHLSVLRACRLPGRGKDEEDASMAGNTTTSARSTAHSVLAR